MATITRDWTTDNIGQLPADFTSDTGDARFISVQSSRINSASPNSLVVKSDGAVHNLSSNFGDSNGGNFTGTQYFRLGGNPIVQFFFRLAGNLSGSYSGYMISLYRANIGSLDLARVVNGNQTYVVHVTDPNGGMGALPENETLALTPFFDGRRMRFQLQRADGAYLTPSGTFVTAPTNCIDYTDTDPAAILTEGKLGYLWFVGGANSFQLGKLSYEATLTPATVTNVTVAPATATVVGGMTQQFAVTVTGTGDPSRNVTWTASAGTITTTGLWTAPPTLNSAQSVTVIARSTLDSTKSGLSTVTVPATSSPQVGQITVSFADGVDLIDYPAPKAGARPVLGVSLLVGTTPNGQSPIPVATNLSPGAGRFTHPCGGYRYKVVAIDTASPALVSPPSNEVQGANAPRGLPVTVAQTTAIVRNILSTFFPPELLVGLAKLQADVLSVDVKKIAGSDLAANTFRDEEINQTIPQTVLDAFGTVAATQLQTKLDATLSPSLIAGLAKLQASALDVNVIQLAGSSDAADKLRDEELSQTVSTAAATAIAAATAAKLAIPSVQDTAGAVWSYSKRTLTTSSSS